MAGKVLIYGGSRGIGAATAGLLHSRRYSLRLVGPDESRLSRITTELEATDTTGDVTDSSLLARVTADAGHALDVDGGRATLHTKG